MLSKKSLTYASPATSAGERRRVELSLGPEELGLWNRELRFVVEPGEFRVWVGGSSEATLGATFKVEAR